MTNREERVAALQHTLSSRGWVDVIKPALEKAISDTTDSWINKTRLPGEEGVTDDQLRERIFAWRWVLGWEERCRRMASQMQAENEFQDATEADVIGGSPY